MDTLRICKLYQPVVYLIIRGKVGDKNTFKWWVYPLAHFKSKQNLLTNRQRAYIEGKDFAVLCKPFTVNNVEQT